MFADLHGCSPFMAPDRIEALVDQTNGLGADLILLLGDYVGHVLGGRGAAPAATAMLLKGLSAPLGVYAVFGNHDWADDAVARQTRQPSHWHSAFEAAGIACLNNDVIRLAAPWGHVQLAGLDSQRAFSSIWPGPVEGADDLEAVLAKLSPDDPCILMAHEPDVFPDVPDHIDLTLSGHTHGGQIAPFGLPLIVPSKYGRRYAYGHHCDGAKHLLVSGGLGYSKLPVRLGRPPELVMVEVAV
ncbi:metallophosphoesterase [Primorskyibacter sp. S187A]|uniref:metallophosphoesterase n=1 Tax=Primorskyibacter sp. S187A TaxID=3415130 RepID=UPI003C7D793C